MLLSLVVCLTLLAYFFLIRLIVHVSVSMPSNLSTITYMYVANRHKSHSILHDMSMYKYMYVCVAYNLYIYSASYNKDQNPEMYSCTDTISYPATAM